MATKIFVNFPVKDLRQSMNFFKQLGFSFNPQFTDETAACMKIAEDIYAMLLTHDKFRQFTSKEIADATNTTEVLTCLALESKEKVNEVADKAIAAGGTESREPKDYGFMYQRCIDDLDGHTWELIWMDPAFVQPETESLNAAVESLA